MLCRNLSSRLLLLPLELYPIIADHLPLYLMPPTLLALALTNRQMSGIVLPILYSRLILKNEPDALKMIQRLLAEPDLGKLVREIHILSDFSLATLPVEKDSFDVLTGLMTVISRGLVPFIHTLGLHLMSGWFEAQKTPAIFQPDRWVCVTQNCPRLRVLTLRGVIDNSLLRCGTEFRDKRWNFSFYPMPSKGKETDFTGPLRYRSFSNNLHTLDLRRLLRTPGFPFFKFRFPKLLSLTLAGFVTNQSSEVITFWQSHPALEYLDISPAYKSDSKSYWFPDDFVVSAGFLPNLKHLKCHFKDARILAPILHQLKSMGIYKSIHTQILHLLRSVLPSSLPNLQSLFINQIDSALPVDNLWLPGGSQPAEEIWQNYIQFLTSWAPNLEELGLDTHVGPLKIMDFPMVPFELGKFPNLRRFFYRASCGNIQESIIENARILGGACRTLELVFDSYSCELPYLVAKILRDEKGQVSSVVTGLGHGMQVGNENEPFCPE